MVVLGGGYYHRPKEPLSARLSETTLHRCLETARLYHQFEQPRILVSGGQPKCDRPGPSLAQAMRTFLVELGVVETDLTLEEHSSTTFENSRETARLLNKMQINSIVLVTDAAHMGRARNCFEHFGILVIPASCHFQSSQFPSTWTWFIPNANALTRTDYAMHEWLGSLWYWLSGSI
ncbi:MAG: YdcF family protein [Pirellulales bacterium]